MIKGERKSPNESAAMVGVGSSGILNVGKLWYGFDAPECLTIESRVEGAQKLSGGLMRLVAAGG